MARVHWRGRVPIGVLALLTLFNLRPQSTGGVGYQYISPLPGSSLNSVSTNIIIRQGGLIDRASLAQKDLIVVSGSSSGIHSGRIILSDDGRTILFQHSIPFAAAEIVTVIVNAGRRTELGLTLDPIRFQFRVANSHIRPEDIRHFLVPEWSTERKLAPASRIQKSGMPGIAATTDSLPAGFPAITITSSQYPTPGEIFLSNFPFDASIPNTPYLMVIDTAGQPVFYRQQQGFCFDFKLQPNGTYTYYDDSAGLYFALDSTGSPVDSFRCGNGYSTDEHDLMLLPNGHALVLGDDFQTVRMDSIVEGGDSSAIVEGIIVQEIDGDKNVVFQWRTWDHFKITDATHEDLTAHFIDAVHSNAISMDTDGTLLLSSRHLDEIMKIDRQTGDIIWRWGGKNNEFTFVDDTRGFSHQHAVRRIPNGDVTLFDNGNFHSPPFSRALEYRLDELGKTATLVWEYRMECGFVSERRVILRLQARSTDGIGNSAGSPPPFTIDVTRKMLLLK